VSDYQQGPDWWIASDGKWYPPQQPATAPPPQPGYGAFPPPHQPAPTASSGGKTILIVVGALFGLAVLGIAGLIVLGAVLGGDDESGDDPGNAGDVVAFCDEISAIDSTSQDERATQDHRDRLDELVNLAPAEIRREAALVIAAQKQLSEAAEFDTEIDPDEAVAFRDDFFEASDTFTGFIDENC
jgi:hypothetical protein